MGIPSLILANEWEFGWGLRDIGGATHFQGIPMQLIVEVFFNIFLPKYVEK